MFGEQTFAQLRTGFKMGRDESRCNVSVTVRAKDTRLQRRKENQKRNRYKVLLLTSLTPCR